MANMDTFEKLVIGLVVVGVVIFVGLRIMSELRTQGNNTADINTAMDEIISAIGDIPSWLVILVVVVIGGFFIVYLRKGLAGKDGY